MRVNNSKAKYKFCNGNSDGDNTIPGKCMETKTELQRFYTQEAAKSALKTKIQYAEEGEKSTRYFYSLERQKQSKQTINVLTKMNLDTITEPHDIITETYNFYKSLYTAQPTDPHQQTDFLSIETPTLTTHDRNFCEGYVTERITTRSTNYGKQQITGTRWTFDKFLQTLLVPARNRIDSHLQLRL